jgi:hypothetical protein
MRNFLLATVGLAALSACTPEYAQPICNRAAIAWDKWGEPTELDEICLPTPVPVVTPIVDLPPTEGNPPVDEPPVDEPPVDEPPVDEPPVDEPKVKGNNGWGNGDQPAPGNSLENNNAENDRGGRSQRNHGQASAD